MNTQMDTCSNRIMDTSNNSTMNTPMATHSNRKITPTHTNIHFIKEKSTAAQHILVPR